MVSLGINLPGQQIKGVVLDQQTGSPIDFASVYIDGTFAGTTTDEEGRFELDITEYKAKPLMISALGYYSNSIKDYKPGVIQQVLLKPRIFEIEEVSVSTKSLVRKRRQYIQIFKREFLGHTTYARGCMILNEEDLTFNYNNDGDTLRAFARRPLQIQNPALGYNITYFLERFEYIWKKGTVLYTGSILFTRDLVAEGLHVLRYERRRKFAFTGSSKHFFRSLWTNSLEKEGFTVHVYRTSDELNYDQIVHQDLKGRKYLEYGEELVIRYSDYLSYIAFLKPKAYFEKDGFFDPTAILWSGKIASQRIADFLPYEYTPME
jgi:hypothetical protein